MCFKEKVIKQGQMEILRQKLLCVGILNLGLMKSKEKRSDGNFPYIFFVGAGSKSLSLFPSTK